MLWSRGCGRYPETARRSIINAIGRRRTWRNCVRDSGGDQGESGDSV